jgi:mono/diheme cytochrome c family protein
MMRRWLVGIAAIIIIVGVAALAFFFWPAGLDPIDEGAVADLDQQQLVALGQQVAIEGDCVACHSIEGGAPYAGGLAFRMPFGTIYSSNITSDPQAGIGAWSNEEFARALRKGVGRDGENLYPAFPYTHYARLTDRDVLALRAYLATVPGAPEAQAANELEFPFDQRWGIRAWNLLFHRAAPFEPDPEQSEAWNRGFYLVEGAGHCGECHTPRNPFFALDNGRKFGGATQQGWNAYNISMHEDGIGSWTDEQLFAYLHTGHADGRGSASGTMGEAVDLSLRHLPDSDIQAMVAYLRTLPETADETAMPVLAEPPLMAQSQPYFPATGAEQDNHALGLRLYRQSCASCHGWDGNGQQSPYGALKGAQTVNDPAGTNLMQVIIKGSDVTSENGREMMPGFGNTLTDIEIAALANYVLSHFGDKQGTVTPEGVAEAREAGH